MNCTIRVVKTKALISFAVTTKLICTFVFAYANWCFSHDAAHILQFTWAGLGVKSTKELVVVASKHP